MPLGSWQSLIKSQINNVNNHVNQYSNLTGYCYWFLCRYSKDITELMLAMLKVEAPDRPNTEQILQQIIIIQNKADNRV